MWALVAWARGAAPAPWDSTAAASCMFWHQPSLRPPRPVPRLTGAAVPRLPLMVQHAFARMRSLRIERSSMTRLRGLAPVGTGRFRHGIDGVGEAGRLVANDPCQHHHARPVA